MKRWRFSIPTAAVLSLGLLTGCTPPQAPAPPPSGRDAPRVVFEGVAPSVVAIVNDLTAEREAEAQELLRTFGDESKAPKKIIDVSLRKEPMPHGTGFMIEGGRIVTAAHVVLRPDKLAVTTRSGQTVAAELLQLDEVRDVAVLEPKQPLTDVPPLDIEPGDIRVGEPVWALGHTGQGLWKLSWGISEGIASGVVDMLGVELLLFDARVYPGFSGGPVVTFHDGKARVIGINHAILYTGGTLATISSATAVSEIRDVLAGKPHPLEQKLAAYAFAEHAKQYADLFVTERLLVHRDAYGRQVAAIFGNAKTVTAAAEQTARLPVVAILFNLPVGTSEVSFELHAPDGSLVTSLQRPVAVAAKQRVSFGSVTFDFEPKVPGRYEISTKVGGKALGSATVSLAMRDEDDQLVDTHDADVTDDGDPDVDVVVASAGMADPLALSGIQSGWAERSYPRRVEYTWFARGTRGWAGTNVAINAFVLDPEGHVVGRSVGCFQPELRPERPWSCLGEGGSPLAMKEGPYDIVFTINDRPVALWPMEAALRTEEAPGSDMERWLKDIKRRAETTVRTPRKLDDKAKDKAKTNKPPSKGKAGGKLGP